MKVLSPILAQLLSASFLRQSYAFQAGTSKVNIVGTGTTIRGVSIFMSRDGNVEKVKRPGSDNNMQPMVESLLSSTINRAISTISSNDSVSDQTSTSKKNVSKSGIIDAAVVRATDQINKEGENSKTEDRKNSTKNRQEKQQTYLQNASVTPTALGHTLWQQVIQPYKDVVVDATAGNGKDSLMLAQMLFPNNDLEYTMDDTDDENPRLICIDIQKEACENTLELLGEHLPDEIIENHIEVLHQSHAPMPSLPKESAGLVCYNLGYLPGVNKKSFQTQMMTSIYSIADSALLIRKGGLLSVISYPGNGWKEHCAVNCFMEGLAMFTTRNEGGWRAYVDSIPTDYELEEQHMKFYGGDHTSVSSTEEVSVRETVRLALERVKADGAEKQTWRVFDHRPLGRPLSPILFTGMRIK